MSNSSYKDAEVFIKVSCPPPYMFVKTQEAFGPLSPIKGHGASVFTNMKGCRRDQYKEFDDNTVLSDAPALYSYPFGDMWTKVNKLAT